MINLIEKWVLGIFFRCSLQAHLQPPLQESAKSIPETWFYSKLEFLAVGGNNRDKLKMIRQMSM